MGKSPGEAEELESLGNCQEPCDLQTAEVRGRGSVCGEAASRLGSLPSQSPSSLPSLKPGGLTPFSLHAWSLRSQRGKGVNGFSDRLVTLKQRASYSLRPMVRPMSSLQGALPEVGLIRGWKRKPRFGADDLHCI